MKNSLQYDILVSPEVKAVRSKDITESLPAFLKSASEHEHEPGRLAKDAGVAPNNALLQVSDIPLSNHSLMLVVHVLGSRARFATA